MAVATNGRYHWAELLSTHRADSFKEQEILPDFLTDFFCGVLGYTRPADGQPRYTISREKHVEVDGKFADAVWLAQRWQRAKRGCARISLPQANLDNSQPNDIVVLMLPDFDKEGKLPPGIHEAPWAEVDGADLSGFPSDRQRDRGSQGYRGHPCWRKRMIKNERQYLVAKTQRDKFARALEQAEARRLGDPLLAKLEADALRSQLEELVQQIAEYELLRSGGCDVIKADSLQELPAALIKARIAARLSQQDLSDRLHLKEQQIQRYEATNYRSASLARLQQVAEALGVEVRTSLFVAGRGSGSAA